MFCYHNYGEVLKKLSWLSGPDGSEILPGPHIATTKDWRTIYTQGREIFNKYSKKLKYWPFPSCMFGNLSHAATLGMEIWGLDSLQGVDQNHSKLKTKQRNFYEAGFIKFANSFSILIHHCEVEISEHLMYRMEFQAFSFPDRDLHLKRHLLCAIFSTLEESGFLFFRGKSLLPLQGISMTSVCRLLLTL